MNIPNKEYVEKAIRLKGSLKLSAIHTPYTEYEIKTWPIQQQEAEAYLADNNASTPTLDTLAQTRKITKTVLVSKIMENVNIIRPLIGKILGEQQALLDELKNTDDFVAVHKKVISW